MKLASLLCDDLIFWQQPVTTVQELYPFIAEKFAHKFNLNQESVLEAFVKRDALGQVTFDCGLALVHGRLDTLDDLIIAVIKPQEAIISQNERIELIFAIITGKSASNFYLKTLAALAGLCSSVKEELKQISDGESFLNRIEELNISLSEPLTVKDIMGQNLVWARREESVSCALDKMKLNSITFMPVVDNNNCYLGKVDLISVLRKAYPDYLHSMQNLGFLSSFSAFEKLEELENNLTVGDIMEPDEEKKVNQHLTAIALGFFFLKHHWHHATVVDDENVVLGVVSLHDILHKVLRA